MKKPLSRRTWRSPKVFLIAILLFIPLVYFGYAPLLRSLASLLIVSEEPGPSDAIVVLGGGEPARPMEAARLYKAGLAPYVVVTTEKTSPLFEEMKKDGVELYQTYENYVRVLTGYGVPPDHILRIEDHIADTLEEITRVRELAQRRGWKKVIVVTSNFHTRRSRLVARYVLAPDIQVTVVAGRHDSFDPAAWWTTQADARTFAIEFEKLVTYGVYMWPRVIWRGLSK